MHKINEASALTFLWDNSCLIGCSRGLWCYVTNAVMIYVMPKRLVYEI